MNSWRKISVGRSIARACRMLLGGVYVIVLAFSAAAQSPITPTASTTGNVVPAKTAAATKTKSTDAVVQEPIKVTLTRMKVVMVNGRESQVAAATAKPGDVLEEVATYQNRSTMPVRKLEATLPIPPNTELVMSSLQPSNASASVDGKTFSVVPLKRKVLQPNGVAVEQDVPLREYRFLRWFPGELAAGETLTVKARFRVIDDQPLPTPPSK